MISPSIAARPAALWRGSPRRPPLAGTGHRPGLAQQADQDRLRLSGRRADRHLRPRLWRGHLAEDRPAGGGREQDRRLGRHRGRAGEGRAARRLHADVDDLDHDDHEQGAVQEAALRPGQGFRADLVDGCRPPADHPAQERAGREPQGVRRLCAQQQGVARHLRRGLLQPCRRRGAEPPFRAHHGGGALPRRGADVAGRGLGRGAGRQRQLRRGRERAADRQRPGDRGADQGAHEEAARRADLLRAGRHRRRLPGARLHLPGRRRRRCPRRSCSSSPT